MSSSYTRGILDSRNRRPQGAETSHRYTFLRPHEVPRFLGCRIITGIPVYGILSLARLNTDYPLPLSKLATRKELTHWLSTQLINILVPGMVHYPGPTRVHFANNPVAFFLLLLYLHSIGYPSHWLSEFLQGVLRNDLTTEAVRAPELPIPVSHATMNVSARKVDLAPWIPELEMILVSTRVGLPFHVRLPENFATTSEEIGTYEANYRWTKSSMPPDPLLSPYDYVAMLVFWRSNWITYLEDISQLIIGSISEKGRATPRKDLVVVNCLEEVGDGKVRWKLAKKRVEKMKREGDWEMALFRSDACVNGESFRMSPPPPRGRMVRLTSVFLQSVMKSPHHNGEKSPLKNASNRFLVKSFNTLMSLFNRALDLYLSDRPRIPNFCGIHFDQRWPLTRYHRHGWCRRKFKHTEAEIFEVRCNFPTRRSSDKK